MSSLNGESLHNWVSSELKRAAAESAKVQEAGEENPERWYWAGVTDTLRVLRLKLHTGQVNPYGDRNLISD